MTTHDAPAAAAAARFEVRAANIMGWALPLAEVARRRAQFTPLPAYVDDFLIGACLLVAARAAARRRPSGDAMLVAAWAALVGGGYYSLFGQITSTEPTDISGLPNGVVVAVKAAMMAVAIAALVRAIRTCARPAT